MENYCTIHQIHQIVCCVRRHEVDTCKPSRYSIVITTCIWLMTCQNMNKVKTSDLICKAVSYRGIVCYQMCHTTPASFNLVNTQELNGSGCRRRQSSHIPILEEGFSNRRSECLWRIYRCQTPKCNQSLKTRRAFLRRWRQQRHRQYDQAEFVKQTTAFVMQEALLKEALDHTWCRLLCVHIEFPLCF